MAVPDVSPPIVLPGVLADIAEVAGREAALKVAAAKGGTRAYFPHHPGAEHWLSLLLGVDAAQAIGRKLAGNEAGLELVVPLGPNRATARIWSTMAEMKAKGHSTHVIARATGRHYKTVQRVTNGKRKTVAQVLAQSDLFETF